MAAIFISSKNRDAALAQALQRALESRGHVVALPAKDSASDGGSRKARMELLRASDAFVPLLTKAALDSYSVIMEIGAARAYAQTCPILVLPVLVGGALAPKLVAGASPVKLKDESSERVAEAAGAIDTALADHLARSGVGCPRIFISHRHTDEVLVKALVRLLETALDIRKSDMRCTSVSPYELPAGADVEACLRSEVCRAKVVLGVVTPDTEESVYVLFELGASWGQGAPTFPLLAKGASSAHIPEPLRGRRALDLSVEKDCHQLIDDLSVMAGLRQQDRVRARVAEEVRALTRQAAAEAGG